MAANPESLDPQAIRSRARGRGFLIPLVAAWPVGLLVGLVAALLGVGVAGAVASCLAAALGLNFVWVVIVLAIDDGHVEDGVREARARAELEAAMQRASTRRSRPGGRQGHGS